ncbi:MAG: AgmX/PglI C-terminal domain-containing protein [Myxococcales bacterium]|nr:AgmX/PglI C-terminal domain-containing protein [Myxococcales bacterium]
MEMFRDGGPWMYALLALGLFLWAVPIAMAAATLNRVRVPALIWIGAASLPLMAGLMGTWSGAMMGVQALSYASYEVKAPLAASALEVSLYTTVAGAFLATLVFAVMALFQGLATYVVVQRQAEERPQDTLAHGAGALAVLFAAVAAAALGGWTGLLSGLALAVGGAAVAARLPAEQGAPIESAAAERGLVAGLGLLSVASLALFSMAWRHVTVFGALARASAEVKAALLDQAEQLVWADATGVGVLGVAVMIGAAVMLIPVARHLLTPRTLASAVGALLVLTPTVGLGTGAVGRLTQLRAASKSFADERAEVLEALDLQLPEAPAAATRPYEPAPVLQLGPQGTTLDGDTPTADALRRAERLAVEAEASTRLSTLSNLARSMTDTPVAWAVASVAGPRTVAIDVGAGATDPDAWKLVPRDGGWRLQHPRKGARGIALAPPELPGALDALGEPMVAVLHVWMPAEATVQDLVLVGAHAQLASSGAERVIWQLGEPPEPLDIFTRDTFELQAPDPRLRASIKEVIRSYAPQIRNCYERQLRKQPSLQGRLVVAFTIEEDGKVSAAAIEDSTLQAEEVEQCLLRQLTDMTFPAPEQPPLEVRWPFVFATE